VRAVCPKCGSESAWFEYSHQDVVLRCLCGLHKLVQSHLGSIVIEHSEKAEDVTLPRQGTKLWECLVALAFLESASTADITAQVNHSRPKDSEYDTNEVSSHLTVLRYKGLVVVTQFRKGLPGGSTWVLTAAATRLLQVR
jgi:hypothetical protein